MVWHHSRIVPAIGRTLLAYGRGTVFSRGVAGAAEQLQPDQGAVSVDQF